jgi:hypothetical protein
MTKLFAGMLNEDYKERISCRDAIALITPMAEKLKLENPKIGVPEYGSLRKGLGDSEKYPDGWHPLLDTDTGKKSGDANLMLELPQVDGVSREGKEMCKEYIR